MWDPRNFRDADFGLDPDELFEPEELDEPEIDTITEPHIMTVLGPVRPDDLGICLPAEKIHTEDPLLALQELTNLVTSGCRAVVDLHASQPQHQLRMLKRIAPRVPLHLIGSVPLREIDTSLHLRPGVVTGSMHDITRMQLPSLPVFVSVREGEVDLPETAVAVLERAPESPLAQQLLQRGHMLIITGIGQGQDAEIAQWIVQAAADGYHNKLMISQCHPDTSHWHATGNQPGLVHLLDRFLLDIMEAGGSAQLVRTMLIENPVRALTINPDR